MLLHYLNTINDDGERVTVTVFSVNADAHFFDFFGVKFIEGEGFSNEDGINKVLLLNYRYSPYFFQRHCLSARRRFTPTNVRGARGIFGLYVLIFLIVFVVIVFSIASTVWKASNQNPAEVVKEV